MRPTDTPFGLVPPRAGDPVQPDPRMPRRPPGERVTADALTRRAAPAPPPCTLSHVDRHGRVVVVVPGQPGVARVRFVVDDPESDEGEGP